MLFISYLFNRFIYRFAEFFRHWYIDSFKTSAYFVISILENLDRRFALKITWRHFHEPLFQDRSIIGYILGFVFRSLRLISGGLIYGIIIIFAVILYIIWLLIPVFIIFRIAKPLFLDKFN